MKLIKSLDDLAVCGATPAFACPLHVGQPNIGNREQLLVRINDMLDRRWFSNHGPLVQELERRIETHLGVRNCIAVCNGTIALEIAIRALGLKGEVIVPSFTFIATAHALQWQQITPVFADIDPGTHNIDPRSVEERISSQTTGIMGVHLWGRPCDVMALTEIAKTHNLRLMFDASHAFSCSHHGRMIGNFGECEVFSFHATKFFNTFEGGAIVTNNDELASRIRLMKNFGFSGYDNVVDIGTNGKMTEVCAAMGLTGLESLECFIEVNRRNYRRYKEQLQGVPGLRLINYDDDDKSNYQYIVTEVDEREFGLPRDALVRVLATENILARRYFFPGCHNMQPYKTMCPDVRAGLPNTEKLSQSIVVLPTGSSVDGEAVNSIAKILQVAHVNAVELRKILLNR